MAKSFAITTTATELTADAKGHAEAVFTVTNSTARPVRLAKAKPLGDTKREWLSVQGEAERDFAAGATQQFSVSFDGPVSEAAVTPPAGGTPTTAGAPAAPATPVARKFPFRLDVASALNPDEDFTEGPAVTVEMMPQAVAPKKKFPLWILFVVLGVLLMIGVVVLVLALRNGGEPNNNEDPEASPSPSPVFSPIPRPQFQGLWVNTDSNTKGNTRLEINQDGSQVSVHAWGKCHPQDCDWGTEKGAVIDNSVTVTWDFKFALTKMVLTLQGDRLKAVVDTVFNDDRPRQRNEYLFRRFKIAKPLPKPTSAIDGDSD